MGYSEFICKEEGFFVIVINKTSGKLLADKCDFADNFWKRFVGLLWRKELKKGEALLISSCNSIHMFFMKFPIDAVFIGKNGIVLKVIVGIMPWRVSPIVKGAYYVLELPVNCDVNKGDFLYWEG